MSASESCLFCKIVRREIPAQEVSRSDEALAIRDVNPQAPTHILVLPTRHVDGLGEFIAGGGDDEVGKLFALATRLGREAGGEGGFRLVVNEGRGAGQTVFHLHVHVLAGRPMRWPPG